MGKIKGEWVEIETARDGIDTLDRIRMEKGLSQMGISHQAEAEDEGQKYYRMYRNKRVKLGTYLRFLRAVGWKMVIVRAEDEDEEKGA